MYDPSRFPGDIGIEYPPVSQNGSPQILCLSQIPFLSIPKLKLKRDGITGSYVLPKRFALPNRAIHFTEAVLFSVSPRPDPPRRHSVFLTSHVPSFFASRGWEISSTT